MSQQWKPIEEAKQDYGTPILARAIRMWPRGQITRRVVVARWHSGIYGFGRGWHWEDKAGCEVIYEFTDLPDTHDQPDN